MQIRRLRLSGFKSFVEPAELRIEPGLTGVVGPNGCGKSNLLEAIRWVMGESSARSMRGGGMDDVIFAGTTGRPARDFAEVIMQGACADGEELEVVRRIDRGAGSAYRINGRDVRAKDVALVFADAATGAHSPALVSQGRIAAVISARPAERRQMLEEAAGIAGLHVRRRDAEQKLRATESNLTRLDDMLAGLDQQIAALRRQARAAERYSNLSGQIRIAEARLVFARWRDAAAAAKSALAEAAEAEQRVGEAQQAATAAQDTARTIAHELAAARDELADRRDDAGANGHRLATLTGQLEAAEQRIADLDRQQRRLDADRQDADRLTRDAAEALARLERETEQGQADVAAATDGLPALRRALDRAEADSRAAQLGLAESTAAQAGVEAEWRIAEAALASARTRLARLDSERARLGSQREALAREDDPDVAVQAAQTAAARAAEALSVARAHFAGRQASKASAQAARDTAQSALAAARADLAGVEREYQALERDRAARARQASGRDGLPLALDRVRAAPGYERALAAVLGRDARAGLGPAPAGDGRVWTGAVPPPPVATSLAAHVPDCPAELAARLALVHVAETDDARALAPGEWLVTLAGHLRRWDGFVARGEGAAEAARLEADNRHAALSAALPGLQAALSAAQGAEAASASALAGLQSVLVADERAVATAAEAERTALRALDRAEATRQGLANRHAELERAGAALAVQQGEAEADIAEAQAALAALPDPALGRTALATARGRDEASRLAQQSAAAALAVHEQALASARERAAALAADMRGWHARAGDATRRLSDMEQRLGEIAEERAVVAAKPPGLSAEIAAAEEVRKRIGQEVASAEVRLGSIEATARGTEAALARATEALASAREHRAGAAARAEAEEQRRAELGRVAGERFQCPPPLLPERCGFAQDDVGAAPAESAALDKLIADRERLGPVNLVAAQELREAEARQSGTLAEQAELSEAINRLRGSIGSLNREGRERLRAAFEAVDGHFRTLFTRLFEGGQAHLALVDSDDPLEAGLEIYAQPPGKRLQSLTLLSGGEQALTAVALIFALFLTNPAPICVLDEVDAPLDDANIERFCDLLDAMARETDTRYLIVTHNAVTMSRMHRLFGVTMVERGVSRLVSVDLGGAEKLLAAE